MGLFVCSRFCKKKWSTFLCLFLPIFIYLMARGVVVEHFLYGDTHQTFQGSSPTNLDAMVLDGSSSSLNNTFGTSWNKSQSTDESKLHSAIVNSSKMCLNLKRPTKDGVQYRNGYWQMSQKGDDEIFLFSAYYDDRPVVDVPQYIRIITVARVSKGSDLHCQVWYHGHEKPFITKVIVLQSGRGHKIAARHYGQWEYSCELPVISPVPSHVSVVTQPCHDSILYLPVTQPEKSQIHEFGICVAIAFGTIPIPQFVEWMELNRIFGVTEFNVYDGNMDADMADIFRYYKERRLLNVVSMPPPVMDFSKNGVKLGSPASLNDCMLRNMYRYKYMIVIDFDEFIVPHEHDDYHTMLQAIDDVEHVSSFMSYTFHNVYFFDSFAQDTSQPEYLRTMRFRNRADVNGYLFAPKSFIDPRRCKSVFNHYCYKRFLTKGKWTIDVKPTTAMSHHYRTCNLGTVKCNNLFKQEQKDDYILKFEPELDKKVKQVFTDIGWKT